DCNKLREIHVAPQNESFCDVDGVVYSKDKTKIIVYPPAYPEEEYHILPSTRKIAELCFKNANNLKTLYIPESVREIGSNALYGCFNLEHVYIEGELKSFLGVPSDEWCPKKTVVHYQNKQWPINEFREAFSQRKQ
ncbi:MAG: leucine-rich repeat domain-containing protein, partial [Bacteroides sp.]|nr:leucine-rich repeat domain-containing protein [Bacteroides sp.]